MTWPWLGTGRRLIRASRRRNPASAELYENGLGASRDSAQAKFLVSEGGRSRKRSRKDRPRKTSGEEPPVAESAVPASPPPNAAPQPKQSDKSTTSESSLTAAQERSLKAGDSFKECGGCPEMIVVPAGRFTMGSPGYGDERPPHDVTIAKPFAVSRFALTFDEWDACAARGDCNKNVSDSGWGRGRRPAINVNWDDAQAYVKWLSRITGRDYRLLSEAEYEYAARAGTQMAYPWGDEIKLNGETMANCNGCGSKWDVKQTAPVGSFAANRFDLYDMVGNVWQWTEDCRQANLLGRACRRFAVDER